MSSCSTNVLAEARAHPLAAHAPPMPPAPHTALAGDGEEAPNGQHHLLRHVLSAAQCSDALRHFGTADSKAAARMVNRMSQRELRDMFAKVYTVHTNSNNNTWLRRKLLEAVGASRRFYAAANRTGRAKGARRSPAAPGPAAQARPRKAAPPPVAPAAEAAPQHAYPLHHAAPASRVLPAGSPRALAQRMRAVRVHPAAGSTTALEQAEGGLPFYFQHQQQQQLDALPHRTHLYADVLSYAPPHPSSDDGATCSDHSGSEGHPAALAPRGMRLESPTSAVAAAMQQQAELLQALPAAAAAPRGAYTFGNNGSVMSSQFAAVLPPAAAASWGLAAQPPRPASAFAWDHSLPRPASLASLLGGYALGGDAAQLPPLVPVPAPYAAHTADLGINFLAPPHPGGLPATAPEPAAPEPFKPDEDWLTWDDCQLPALF